MDDVDQVLVLFAALLVGFSLLYGFAMLAASRLQPRQRSSSAVAPDLLQGGRAAVDDLFFVFLLPCLNEGTVIRESIERLLAIPGDNFAVMVIDDGSDDDTARVATDVGNGRVWLLRRTAPHARQGKGEALNAAIRHLVAIEGLRGVPMERVIIVVVDADGRLEPGAAAEVAPFFADARVGGVQIGVRINNRQQSLLARMQDMEFVIYTEVFQRGRRHLGSVGLGGNGQFMRLSALLALGSAPWSRSLTEDLDLGVRLLALGWRNEFCSQAAVHQQGVLRVRPLVRQRSRWFQGHLQSWRLVSTVLRFAPPRARTDVLYHLTSPWLLLIASLLTGSFLVSCAASIGRALGGHPVLGWWLLTTYVLSFAPAVAYSYVYWLKEREHLSLLRCVLLAHVYVVYGLMWCLAGWWAVWRSARGRTAWVKTARTAEEPAWTLPVPDSELVG